MKASEIKSSIKVLAEVPSITKNGDSMWTYWVLITIEIEGAKREFVRKLVIFA